MIRVTGEGENPAYPNYLAMELIKDKCAIMDQYQVGSDITVHFNMSGRLWQQPGKAERCFNSLQAWRVEGQSQSQQPNQAPAPDTDFGQFDEDIPF